MPASLERPDARPEDLTSSTEQTAPVTGRPLQRLRERAEQLIFCSPPLVWIAAVLGLIAAKNGVWHSLYTYGALEARLFPHASGDIGQDYLLGSPLDLALAHALGLTSPAGFFLEHLFALVAFIAILCVGSYRKGGRFGLAIALVIFFTSVLSNIEFSYIGFSDPFTLIFLTLIVLTDSPWVGAIGGLGVGLSHAEVGWFAIIALIALNAAGANQRIKPLVLSAIGLTAGTICTVLLDIYAGVGPDPRGTWVHWFGIHNLLFAWFAQLPILVYTLFGAGWGAVVLLRNYWAPTGRTYKVGVVIAIAALLMVAITYDESRIAALLLWAPLFWISMRLPKDDRYVTDLMTWTFIAAVVLPQVWVEGGGLRGASLWPLDPWR